MRHSGFASGAFRTGFLGRAFPVGLCLAGIVLSLSGCSAVGMASTAVRVSKNLMEKDSELLITLDGQLAMQDKLKKGIMGDSAYACEIPVSLNPSFKYEFDEPQLAGRVTGTSIQVFKEFSGEWSERAEFIVMPRATDAGSMMQAGSSYSLANPGGRFRVIDFNGNEIGGVRLESGTRYLLVFNISGDKNESAQVEFETSGG